MKVAIMLILLTAVGLFAGRQAGRGGPGFMVSLETAGDVQTIQDRMEAHHLSAADVRAALELDDLFLVCYGLWTALVASRLGGRLGGRWDDFGAAAAFASLLAAVLDAVENTALLHALEQRPVAALAAAAAESKFLLIGAALAYVAMAALAVVIRAFRRRDNRPLPAPGPAGDEAPQPTCDVVMKGGITSGVVYPRAVARLASAYRFVNVGGSSAGAIAASATAAAEYARANGRDAFTPLAQLPAWLGARRRLFNLFRPNPSMRPHFEVFTAFLGHVPFPFKLARAFATAAAWFPVTFAIGLLPGALLLRGAVTGSAPAWGATGAVAASLLAVPLVLLAGFVLTICWRLPRNDFGMCSGMLRPRDGEVLSRWLADLINDLAGLPREGRPLIFADLWTAGEGRTSDDDVRLAAAGRTVRERQINFEALTTSLSHGRPYRMPELGQTFYFRREDLERVLPTPVVDWMANHPGKSEYTVAQDFMALPAPQDLPVVFAARLSLSFPFLLSAVKLWGIDWRHPDNKGRKRDDVHHLSPVWMSDGGIASNFPIHFFDTLIPGRPTFGFDLSPFARDFKQRSDDEAENVLLPGDNAQGALGSWNNFKGVGGFIAALMDALQAFIDNMQAHAPGFRDRIARIYLESDEGGMNLAMPAPVVARLGDRGQAAADKIVQRFLRDTPSGWDNHRWVRLRSLLGELDPLLRDFHDQMQNAPAPEPPPGGPRSYAWPSTKELELAKSVIEDLKAIGRKLDDSGTNLCERQPRPLPVLRSTPRV